MPLPEPFDYAVPDDLDVVEGSYVAAPLGKHERLAALEIRGELPKTMIGKPDRKALRAEIAEASDTAKARQDDPPGSHEIAG